MVPAKYESRGYVIVAECYRRLQAGAYCTIAIESNLADSDEASPYIVLLAYGSSP